MVGHDESGGPQQRQDDFARAVGRDSDDDSVGGPPADVAGSDEDIDDFIAGPPDEEDALLGEPTETAPAVREDDSDADERGGAHLRAAAPAHRYIEGAARRTAPVMSIFEYAGVIGERATAIEQGAEVPAEVEAVCREAGLTAALDIAEVEVEMSEVPLPLYIHRRVAPDASEVWGVRELRLPSQVETESFSAEATRLLHEYAGRRDAARMPAMEAVLRKFTSPGAPVL